MAGAEQAALFAEERTWRVGELVARISKVVATAFASEVWVGGEVDGLRPPNASGHVYFTLCERNSRRGPASTINVSLYRQDRLRVERELREWPEFRLADGLEVRLRGRVQYSYGRLQLVMSALDPVHTLGRLAADRERVLRTLAAEGLLEANGRLPLPAVPLHLGLVTSAGSAACEDVLAELRSSGFGFRVSLADAQVQGTGSGPALRRALTLVTRAGPDVVLLVRGGGSRTDLAPFDAEALARTIAAMPVPVLTGIGHEIDSSVADEVAHTSFKTPTACAAGITELVRAAVGRAESAWSTIGRHRVLGLAAASDQVASRAGRCRTLVAHRLDRASAGLDEAGRVLDPARLASRLRRAEDDLALATRRMGRAAATSLAGAAGAVDVLAARAAANDPTRALARGWTLTRTADGRLVRRADELAPGDTVVTTFPDGRVSSTVSGVSAVEEAT